MVVLSAYFWLCSRIIPSRGPDGMLEIEYRLATCKISPYLLYYHSGLKLLFCFIMGHIQQCSGISPGSAIREYSWQVQGTI